MQRAINNERRVTAAMEDYLKAIYLLQRQGQKVSTSSLAEQLGGLRPGSVTPMVKKLAKYGLVEHTPYYGVVLTASGERIALEVIRHHRLIELYLVQVLGYRWDEVHEDADALEHVISEKLEAQIAAQLNHPTLDPHGDPIPTLDGIMPDSSQLCIADLDPGHTGVVARVGEQQADRLRYLAELGLVPGARVALVARAPFDGPLTVQIDGAPHVLDQRLARTIFVQQEPT